ncbi:hypothetical protein FRB94_000941 [Tulasnella sp. JGI-2019a]|nr:hypothetical protein FRB94_000941 [Tulasnella sp. JGI-2019a]KAG9018317.1 hypothetical protein FRB93_000020 [Tulasnella sp. JGI-2019a]
MPVITELTDLQRGTLWGEYVETFLIGIYTCLIMVTLWRPIEPKQPLTLVGRTIIAIYCLALCRIAISFWILYRTLFVNGGDFFKLEPIDYVIRGLQEGLAFTAILGSDGLFCWRLYVIWSRNTCIVLLPACLLVANVIGFSFIVATDFLLAARPNDQRYTSLHSSLFIWVSAAILAYTFYITIFITSKLWWVGRATNKLSTTDEKRRNQFQGAINAIIQSGAIYFVLMILSLISTARMNVVMMTFLGCINPSLNGILTTLLVLKLNMWQDRTKRDEDSKPTAMTGASIHFATPQGTSSTIIEERTQLPVMRHRRASIATCQHCLSRRGVVDASGQLIVTFSAIATPTSNRVHIRTVP